MKKLFILVLLLFMIFPLLGEIYKVTDIEGKVFYGISQNELQIGDTLNEDEVLNVKPQAKITLQIENSSEKRIFKKPIKGITVKEAWDSSIVSKGLKKQVVVKPTTIAPSNKGTNKSVVTAASRASEAKEDLDWAE
jgi:hypothetical protein